MLHLLLACTCTMQACSAGRHLGSLTLLKNTKDTRDATDGWEKWEREDLPYVGWLEAHSERWTELADVCEAEIIGASAANNINTWIDPSSYSLCLSMVYGWIDNEAATTGIRIESSSSSGSASETAMVRLVDALEDLEPGYAAQRDKHSSFVEDITGKADVREKASAAKRKVDAAAAYLTTNYCTWAMCTL